MATINKKKICNKHGFYNGIEFKRCPLCKKTIDKVHDTQIRKKANKSIYNNVKWTSLRLKILDRDLWVCQTCGARLINNPADKSKRGVVHHKIEINEDMSLAYDIDNLESICVWCHTQEHKGEGTGDSRDI